MQIIAYISMLLTHFLKNQYFNISFPIFAYYAGKVPSEKMSVYSVRIVVVGLVSQLFWPIKDMPAHDFNAMLVMGITCLSFAEKSIKADILKIVIFIGWLKGVCAVEYLYFMLLSREGDKYFIGGLILYSFFLSIYQLYYIILLTIPVIMCFNLPKGFKTRFKYIVYPVHLAVIKYFL